ncbi:hypothetical protein Pan14r_38390 [Crateriforma conspicua]|uniref:Uncharacterized protein n=1 Tax=Crateriforma conspicua TaxID=2527996 RepID=A0A5C5Y9D5_9PLAN|nr:hypothetical protein Pan14r_38390 [Crateriforma conspicua]
MGFEKVRGDRERPPISETATMTIAEISVLKTNDHIASAQCSWLS